MNLKERILVELMNAPLSDRKLADKLLGTGAAQQSVNQACRQLAETGVIIRTAPPIKNILVTGQYTAPTSPKPIPKQARSSDSPLQEEEIKAILKDFLTSAGWQVKVAWGNAHDVDLYAIKGEERWVIEVKGCGSLNPMRVNYFLGILGETLQRMDDPKAHYSIALPDMQQFRNLWDRLPDLAKQRTTIDAIFVSRTGNIDFIK